MRKLSILFLTIFLFSCENDHSFINQDNIDERNLQLKSNIKSNSLTLTLREVDMDNRCGSSGGSSFQLNPNGFYVNWETVYYLDGSCDGSTACLDLAHFVDRYVVYNQRITPAYFGYSQYSDFMNVPSSNTFQYRIEQEVDMIPYMGDYFPSSSPMSNDIMNSVLQQVQQEITSLQSGGNTIKAVYFSTENYLCIPATRGFNFSIKFS